MRRVPALAALTLGALALTAVRPVVVVAGSPADAPRPAVPGLTVFDAFAQGGAVLQTTDATSAAALTVDSGNAVSIVKVNSSPFVLAEGAVSFAPLAETPSLLGLPDYPTQPPFCTAYFPGDPHEISCGGPGPEVGGSYAARGGSASGKATGSFSDPGKLSGAAAAYDVGLTPVAGSDGPFSAAGGSSTAAASPVAGAITGSVSALVRDVTVAGVLNLASVSSSISAEVRGTPGGVTSRDSFRVEGATVAGSAVAIDGSGVHALGAPADGGAATLVSSQVNAALANAGLTVALLPATPPVVAADGTSFEETVGGVGISFRNPDNGILETLVLGRSTLRLSTPGPVAPFAAGPAGSTGTAPSTAAAGAPPAAARGAGAGGRPAKGTTATGTTTAATAVGAGAAGPAGAGDAATSVAGGGGPPAVAVPGALPVAGPPAAAAVPSSVDGGSGGGPPVTAAPAAATGPRCAWQCVYPGLAVLIIVFPFLAALRRMTLLRRPW